MMFRRCRSCFGYNTNQSSPPKEREYHGQRAYSGIISELLHEEPLPCGADADHLTGRFQINVLQNATLPVLFADFAHAT
jgi:hypothetical protein